MSVATQAPPDRSTLQLVPIARLKTGVRLKTPIYDDGNVLLLTQGVTITPTILERLARRGIDSVRVHPSELARMAAAKAAFAAELESSSSRKERAAKPFAEQIVRPAPLAKFEAAQVARAEQSYSNSVAEMDEMFISLAKDQVGSIDGPKQLAGQALDMIAQDCDLVVKLGICTKSGKYPARHSIHTAMLAMSLGANLGLGKAMLLELGMGCLLHDVGMLKVNPQIYDSDRVLSRNEFIEITKHPSAAYDILSQMSRVPVATTMVAYQLHERCDGTGYPRARRTNQIHPLARIAAVADAFVGMVSERPHRPGMLPYQAVVELLRSTNQGQFDSQVTRALLQTISLFPIGSCVQMADGSFAQVARANPEDYTRPVVQVLTGPLAGRTVNLLTERNLKVAQPAPATILGK